MGGKGSGGKNRKPTAIKKAEGNRGKRGLNQKEPEAQPGEPKMPAGMTRECRAVWSEVCEMLRENGVLFKSDGIAIHTLCSTLVRFRDADARVAESSRILSELDAEVEKETARFMKWSRSRSDAEKHLRANWQVFGLDPASRPGVQVTDRPETKPQSALEAIIRAKSANDDIVN